MESIRQRAVFQETSTEDARSLYLDLMKKCVTYYLWGSPPEEVTPQCTGWAARLASKWFLPELTRQRIKLMREVPFDAESRTNGRDIHPCGDTMIGLKRLDNLQRCIELSLADNVPGDFIETGVWRGGGHNIYARGSKGV